MLAIFSIILCSQIIQLRRDIICICFNHVMNPAFGPDFRHRLEATENNTASLCYSHTESLIPSSVPSFSASHLHQSWFQMLLAVLRCSVDSQRTKILPRVVTGQYREELAPKAVLKENSFRNIFSNDIPIHRNAQPPIGTLKKGMALISMQMLKISHILLS